MKKKRSMWVMLVGILTIFSVAHGMVGHEPLEIDRSVVNESSGSGMHRDSTLSEEQLRERALQQAALRKRQTNVSSSPLRSKKPFTPTLQPVREVPEPSDIDVVASHLTGADADLTAGEKQAIEKAGTQRNFLSSSVRVESPEEVIAQHKATLAKLEAQLARLKEMEQERGANRAQLAKSIEVLNKKIEDFVKTVIPYKKLTELPEAPKPIELPKQKTGFFKKKSKTSSVNEAPAVSPLKVKVGFFDGLAVKTVLKNESVQADLQAVPHEEGYPTGREVVNMVVVYMRKGKTPPTPDVLLQTVLSSVRDSSTLTLDQEEQYKQLIADVYDALLSKGKLAKAKGKDSSYGSQVASFRSKLSETVMNEVNDDSDLMAVEEVSFGDKKEVVNNLIQDLRNGNSPETIVRNAKITFEELKRKNAIKQDAVFPEGAYVALAGKVLKLLIDETALTQSAAKNILHQQVDSRRQLEAEKAQLLNKKEELDDEAEASVETKKELEAEKAQVQAQLQQVVAQQKADRLTQKVLEDALAEMKKEQEEAEAAAAAKAQQEKLEQERLAALQREQEEQAQAQALAAELEKARQQKEDAKKQQEEAAARLQKIMEARALRKSLENTGSDEERQAMMEKVIAQQEKAAEDAAAQAQARVAQLQAQEEAAQSAAAQAAGEVAQVEAQEEAGAKKGQSPSGVQTRRVTSKRKKKSTVGIYDENPDAYSTGRKELAKQKSAAVAVPNKKPLLSAEELKAKALEQQEKMKASLNKSLNRFNDFLDELSGKVKGLFTSKPTLPTEPRTIGTPEEEERFADMFVEIVNGEKGTQTLLADMPESRKGTMVKEVVAQLRAGLSPAEVLEAELKNPMSALRKLLSVKGTDREVIQIFKKQPELIDQYKKLIADVWLGMADPGINLLPSAPDGSKPNYYQNLVQAYGMKIGLDAIETRILAKLFERKRDNKTLSEEEALKFVKEIQPVVDKVFTSDGLHNFLKKQGFLPLSTEEAFTTKLAEIVGKNHPDTETDEQAVWRIIYQSRLLRGDADLLPTVFKAVQKIERRLQKQQSSKGTTLKETLATVTSGVTKLAHQVKDSLASSGDDSTGEYKLDLEAMKKDRMLRQTQQAVDDLLNAEPNARKAKKALDEAEAKLKEAQTAKTAGTSDGKALISYWEGRVAQLKIENDKAQGYLEMLRQPLSASTDEPVEDQSSTGKGSDQQPASQPVRASGSTATTSGKSSALTSLRSGWDKFATKARGVVTKANEALQRTSDALAESSKK